MPATLSRQSLQSIANLMESLGDIPISRVRRDQIPGKATEKDLLRIAAKEDTLVELVDGVLVEKPMGWKEAFLTMWLLGRLAKYLDTSDLGALVGPDGAVKLRERLIRIPDIAFILWENVPAADEKIPAYPDVIPDLAVEVISPSNTRKEMDRKRSEYFEAGTTLVWLVYPESKQVEVYTSPSRVKTLAIGDTLDGGTLLPGFRLPLTTLFAVRGGTKRGSARKKKKK